MRLLPLVCQQCIPATLANSAKSPPAFPFPPVLPQRLIPFSFRRHRSMHPRPSLLAEWRLFLGLLLILLLGQSPCAAQFVFSNSVPIMIPDSGPAQPFGASISVAGVTGVVSKVTVTLNGLNHTWLEDLSVLLLAPNGQQVMLFSGAGRDCNVHSATLTFDDAAAAPLPVAGPIASGTYQPNNYVTNLTTITGVPDGPHTDTLSGLNGIDPNGTWALFVMDNAAEDQGAVAGGWGLVLTISSPPTTTVSAVPALAPAPMNSVSSTPPSGIQSWQNQYFSAADLADPAKEATVWGELADPDHDGQSNLLEYALGLDPLNPGDVSRGLTAQVLANGTNHYQSLTFQRRKDDPGLVYSPLVSADLEHWSPGSAILQVNAQDLSPALEQVTYLDLSPIAVGQPRFFRLQVQAADGQVTRSIIYGATAALIRGGYSGGSQLTYFGLSFVQPAEAAGAVTSLGTNTFTDSQANWPPSLLNASNGTFYAEFASGLNVDIVAADAPSRTLTVPGDLRPYLSAGSIYRIRRHTTLANIFGPNNEAGLAGGLSTTEADNVMLRNNQNQTTQLYYFSNATGNTGWYRADYASANGAAIYPEQGIMVSRKVAGDVVVYMNGVVKEGPTAAPIYPGLNLVGTLKAKRSLALSELNLYTGDPATGLAAGSSPAAADNLMVPTATGTAIYFYCNIPGYEGWLDGTYRPANGVQLAPGCAIFLMRKAPHPEFQWLIPSEQ